MYARVNRDRRTRLATNLWHDSREFTEVLQDRGVRVSMDGKGRYFDNVLVELRGVEPLTSSVQRRRSPN